MDITDNLPVPVDVETELDRLAKRYRAANGMGMNVLNLIGGSAENLLNRCLLYTSPSPRDRG